MMVKGNVALYVLQHLHQLVHGRYSSIGNTSARKIWAAHTAGRSGDASKVLSILIIEAGFPSTASK